MDLTAAFSNLCRQLVVPDHEHQSDEELAKLLCWCGIANVDIPDAMSNIAQAAEWVALGVSQHACALTERLHQDTWFSTDSLAGVMQTYKGALAGTTLADIVFSAFAAKGCACARKGLQEQLLVSS